MKLLSIISLLLANTVCLGQTNNKTTFILDCDSFRNSIIGEQMPLFLGGEKALTKFLKTAKGMCDSHGTVKTSFIVDENGEISCIKTLNFISKSCNDEAIRIIQSMPKWNP